MKSSKIVLAGLTIVDNLCKNESEKLEIKNSNILMQFSVILDNLGNDERVEQTISKIIKILINIDDILKEINILTNFNKTDYSSCIHNSLKLVLNLESSLSKISTFILVEEFHREFNKPENIQLLYDLYEAFAKLSYLNSNFDDDNLNIWIRINKNFMKIFIRLLAIRNDNNCEIINHVFNYTISNWNLVKSYEINDGNKLLFNEYLVLFSYFFDDQLKNNYIDPKTSITLLNLVNIQLKKRLLRKNQS